MAQRIAVLLTVASILVLSSAADGMPTAQKYDKSKHHYEKYDKEFKSDYRKPSNYEEGYEPHPESDYHKPAPYGGKPYEPSYPPYGGKPYPPSYLPPPYYAHPYDPAYGPPYGSYDNTPKITRRVAEMSVSSCSPGQYKAFSPSASALMAQLDLTCSTGNMATPDGKCLVVYEFGEPNGASSDWFKVGGTNPLNPVAVKVDLTAPAQVGMWKATCSLSKTCLPNHGYGSSYQGGSDNTIDVMLEGVVMYVDTNVFSRSLRCFLKEGDFGRKGLIRNCIDVAIDDGYPKKRRVNPGQDQPLKTDNMTDAEEKSEAKVAYNGEYNGEPLDPKTKFYRLDFAQILKGTATYYDGKEVKRLGDVQIVETVNFDKTGLLPTVVERGDLPPNPTIVDCAEVELDWLNAHNYY